MSCFVLPERRREQSARFFRIKRFDILDRHPELFRDLDRQSQTPKLRRREFLHTLYLYRPLVTSVLFQYYQFTQFAMSLNELKPDMKRRLCPTDSRLRPDIRKLEEGDTDGAAVEKTRLEEKQRDSDKLQRGKKPGDWLPRYVRERAITPTEICVFCFQVVRSGDEPLHQPAGLDL